MECRTRWRLCAGYAGNTTEPLLEVPNRDVVTENGTKLTKINPAFMTRLIAEIANKENMVIFHITSTKPIRPGNAADPWEVMALEAFRQGSKEASELVESRSGKRLFRYMAPLWVEKSCLKCHAAQGYQENDLRGDQCNHRCGTHAVVSETGA